MHWIAYKTTKWMAESSLLFSQKTNAKVPTKCVSTLVEVEEAGTNLEIAEMIAKTEVVAEVVVVTTANQGNA